MKRFARDALSLPAPPLSNPSTTSQWHGSIVHAGAITYSRGLTHFHLSLSIMKTWCRIGWILATNANNFPLDLLHKSLRSSITFSKITPHSLELNNNIFKVIYPKYGSYNLKRLYNSVISFNDLERLKSERIKIFNIYLIVKIEVI